MDSSLVEVAEVDVPGIFWLDLVRDTLVLVNDSPTVTLDQILQFFVFVAEGDIEN